MLKSKNRIFILVLMPIVLSCLSSCATTNYNLCPQYPIAGEKVATELEKLPAKDLEATWEWLGRINKLRQELEICHYPS